MKPRLRSISLLLLLLIECAGALGGTMRSASRLIAPTQDYPAKPVRIIEPFGLGGGPNLLARALAPKLSELWGQPVTVENHAGAGATAAPALVAKSPADGYTLLINTSAQAYSAVLSKKLPYDPLKDFIPVASLTTQPYVLVAGKPAGVTTVRELIANSEGQWKARHQMTINGKANGFALEDFRACAATAGMKRGRDREILREVVEAVLGWPRFAQEAGVSSSQRDAIARAHRLDFGQGRRPKVVKPAKRKSRRRLERNDRGKMP
jgi:Tripartite tricarboxylate transporter family receptor